MNASYCYSSSYALACGSLEIGPLDERAAEDSRRFGKHIRMLPFFSKVQLSIYDERPSSSQIAFRLLLSTNVATLCWAAEKGRIYIPHPFFTYMYVGSGDISGS